MQIHLPITSLQILNGESFGSSQRVQSVVNPGQWETAFIRDFQFLVVYAEAQVPVLRTRTTGNNQGLSYFSITPCDCISSSISPTSACFAWDSFLGDWGIVRPSPVSRPTWCDWGNAGIADVHYSIVTLDEKSSYASTSLSYTMQVRGRGDYVGDSFIPVPTIHSRFFVIAEVMRKF
jgi:hypothetical protein